MTDKKDALNAKYSTCTTMKSLKNIFRNRGIGAGGSNTNKNGLGFENKTDILQSIKIIKKEKLTKTQYAIYTKINNKNVIILKKCGFIKYFKNKKDYNYNPKNYKALQPDLCILDEENNCINIIEKKFQSCSGSVDEKLQTFQYKIWLLQQLCPNYEIKYYFCLCNWFKQKRYEPEMEYFRIHKIRVFWGEDENYLEELKNAITN